MKYQVEIYVSKVNTNFESVTVVVDADSRKEAIEEARFETRARGEVISAKKVKQ
jgi:hypothetical protein